MLSLRDPRAKGGRETMVVSFKGAHFPQEIILTGVRWYVAYPLSTRHVEELMLERGVHVDHSTIRVIQFSSAIPMSASAKTGWAAKQRQAAAIFVYPAQRIRPMTVLRSAAITCGMLPQRTCDRSSSKVTSRTQWDWFSICHCPRTSAS